MNIKTGLKVMGLALVATFMMGMSGCQTPNPNEAAGTDPERQAFALYGEFTIVERRGAELIQNPSVPDSVKQGIQDVDARAKPLADGLLGAALNVQAIRYELAAGDDNNQKLVIAITNLDKWTDDFQPVMEDLREAVANKE